MELDTTKNLTKISNKDGSWFSEHSLETVKSVWKKKVGNLSGEDLYGIVFTNTL